MKGGGEGGGEGVHTEAEGTGELGCGGEAEGDDEEAPGGAEGEIVGCGFEAVGEGFVGYEDYPGAEGFGFGAYGFFFLADEG